MQKTISILKALSDMNRLRIALMLRQRPLCVCELDQLLDISYPTVSANLRVLKNAEIIDYKKDGKWVIYHLTKDSKINKLLNVLSDQITDKEIVLNDIRLLKKTNREICSVKV